MRLVPFLILLTVFSCQRETRKTPAVVTDKTWKAKPIITRQDIYKKELVGLFETWKKDMIANGRFLPEDTCMPDIVMSPRYDNYPNPPMWGFPESIDYLYGDLNDDGQIDQLVTFEPRQCDGGNGSMWTQLSVLSVSENGTYTTKAYIGEGVYSFFGKDDDGFFFYDSIAPNKIFATYYKFLEDDGHCCPSIEKKAVMDYRTKEWKFLTGNIAKYD